MVSGQLVVYQILQLQYQTCIHVYTIDMVLLLTNNLNKKHSICVSTINTDESLDLELYLYTSLFSFVIFLFLRCFLNLFIFSNFEFLSILSHPCYFFFFFFEEPIILIRIHKHKNSIQNFLNKFIIYYIIKESLQKDSNLVFNS